VIFKSIYLMVWKRKHANFTLNQSLHYNETFENKLVTFWNIVTKSSILLTVRQYFFNNCR
jgi:hypothetical protein